MKKMMNAVTLLVAMFLLLQVGTIPSYGRNAVDENSATILLEDEGPGFGLPDWSETVYTKKNPDNITKTVEIIPGGKRVKTTFFQVNQNNINEPALSGSEITVESKEYVLEVTQNISETGGSTLLKSVSSGCTINNRFIIYRF